MSKKATLEDFMGISGEESKYFKGDKLYIQDNRKQQEYGPKKFIKP